MQLPAEISFTSADTRRPKVILAICIACCVLCVLAAFRFSWWLLIGVPLGILVAYVAIQALRALRGRFEVRHDEVEYHDENRNLLFSLGESRVVGDRIRCLGLRFHLTNGKDVVILPRSEELVRFLRRQGLFDNEVEPADEADLEMTTPHQLLRSFQETGRAEVTLASRSPMLVLTIVLAAFGVFVGGLYVFLRVLKTEGWLAQAIATPAVATVGYWIHKWWPKPQLCFDQDAVTLQTLFDAKRIAYENVTAVRFKKGKLSSRRLFIESPQGSVCMLENDPSLPPILALLKHCCPSVAHHQAMDKNGEAQDLPMTGEYVVPVAKTEAIGWLIVAVLITLAAGALVILLWHEDEPLGVAILLGVSAASLILYGAYWLLRLRAYVFNDTVVVWRRVIGTSTVNIDDLCEVRLDFEYDDATSTGHQKGHHKIKLVFPNKMLKIDGRRTTVAVVELHEYLRNRYLKSGDPPPQDER